MVTNISNAVVWIVDTGKLRTTSTSATETDKVNSGSTITLSQYIQDIKVDTKGLTNKSASPMIYENESQTKQWRFAEADGVGLDLPVWTVQLNFNCANAQDMIDYGRVMRLVRTKGYKQLFVSNLTEYYAYEENYYGDTSKTANTVLSYVNVRPTAASADWNGNGNRILVSLELVETR